MVRAEDGKAEWEDTMIDLPSAPPPHRIDDITRLLDHYKPNPERVESLRRQAEATPPESADRKVLFEFYVRRGNAAGQIGRAYQQIADLRKAVDEYGEKRTQPFMRALRDLSSAESWGGNLLNALKRSQEALENVQSHYAGAELGARQQVVAQSLSIGDFDTAREHLRQAEGLFTLVRRWRSWDDFGATWVAAMERSRGEVFRGEGRYVEAEGAFRRALRANEEEIRFVDLGRKRQGDDADTLDRSLNFRELLERSLASVLLAQGKIAEAEAMVRQALVHSLERVGRGATPTALGLNLLAAIIAEQGRYSESALLAEEALKSHEMAGSTSDSLFFAHARRTVASAYVAQGRYQEAVKVFGQMRAGLQSSPELLEKVGSSDLDWVLAMLRTGDQAEAERMAKRMYDRARERLGEEMPRTVTIRAFYAMTLAARGALDESRAHFNHVIPFLVKQARLDAEAETQTIKRQQRLVLILESYLKLLSSAVPAGQAMTGKLAEEAFQIADIARASTVQRALTASAARATISDPKLEDLARREQGAQQRINTLSDLLTQLLSAPPDQQLPKIQAKMRDDIDALRKVREALRKEIAERYPDYAELVDPAPAAAGQVARSLRQGEVLLAFYFGEEDGYAWALRRDGPAAFARTLARTNLAREVSSLRNALDAEVAHIDDIPSFDVGIAHRLYSNLLGPFAAQLAEARLLLVIPHAELGQLPLGLLVTQAVPQPGKTSPSFEGYKAVPWLVRHVAIAQLPSATSLASLRRLPPGDPAWRPFIGFGDPFFSKAQAESAGTLQIAKLSSRGVRLRSSPQTAKFDSAGLALLPRLPDTNTEIREIADIFNADLEQDVFLQRRATVKQVLEIDLSRRRIVMFSTHGLVPGDLDGLLQPALALTSPEVVSDGGSGLLTMEQVLKLKLNADWVVLSACNTASGDGKGSEAVSGLGRAFFFAGARALLASNWPVATDAARLLMTDLFRRQGQQAGLGKAEALRQAMLALLDGPGAISPEGGKPVYAYAHPLFWAPFVLVGD